MNINKDNFAIYLDSVNQCYDKRCSKNLPNIENFPDDLFKANGELVTEDILDFASKQSNVYLLSVVRRIVAVFKIQEAREKN